MNTIKLLSNENELVRYVLSELQKSPNFEIAARNNTLNHFYFVGCPAAESIICALIDTDSSENLSWFIQYLDQGEGRNNSLNRKISETFWLSNSNETDEIQKFKLFFWHGEAPKFVAEVKGKLGNRLIEHDGNFFYKGTLDEFSRLYGNHFMFKPKGDWNLHTICVTQYSSFD